MFPIRTENPVYSRPFATACLIGLNLAAFLWMRSDGDEVFQRRVFEYGLVPATVAGRGPQTFLLAGADPVAAVDRRTGAITSFDRRLSEQWIARGLKRVAPEALDGDEPFELRSMVRGSMAALLVRPVRQRVPPWLAPLTSMFLHASWVHLLGNLWFLWLFGAGVEDVLGRFGYLAFYLVAGIAAAAAHIADDVSSRLPCIGASGAISGVMGGFLIVFPRARVLALGPLLLGGLIPLPAFVFLALYLLEQIFMSLQYASEGGGVAWWAHIGGFVAGMALIKAFPVSEAWTTAFGRRRTTGRVFGYDYGDDDDEPPRRRDGPYGI